MRPLTYLVFGDLHGRILPAFRLAIAWSREHNVVLDGLLQVGDLGWFPDWTRIDKATKKHAEKDPLEMGSLLVAAPSKEADAVFAEEGCPSTLWFTAGNHEDHEILEGWGHGAGPRANSFFVDSYLRLSCVRDGHIAEVPGGLRVGALWGIDDQAPRARQNTPRRGRIRSRSATELACASFDVLLTHESPRDAIFPDSGSEDIGAIIRCARPAFAFFGHYHGTGMRVDGDFGDTQVYHMSGLEMRQRGHAEAGSVGALTWDGERGSFTYLEPMWLASFTRSNWKHR
jgi:hypothetical protein